MLTPLPPLALSALERKMASTSHDGLYCVSMDHCPSEQLGNCWHTTAIILSAHVEHDQFGAALDARLRGKGLPGKWNTAPTQYKQKFLSEFVAALPGTEVYAFAISAHGSAIDAALPRLKTELGIDGIYKEFETDSGKKRTQIGPVFHADTGEKLMVDLPPARAAMCIFIAHFIHRVKTAMFVVRDRQQGTPEHINWNFFADKFPGPQGKGDMELLFRILLSYGRETGRLAWGYFDTKEEQTIDLLADQFAGALNAALLEIGAEATLLKLPSTDDFYWERWI